MSMVSLLICLAPTPSHRATEQGEILGHNLMSPHTILSNAASISDSLSPQQALDSGTEVKDSGGRSSSSTDFLSYVESLLEKPCQESGASLLSPTESKTRSFPFTAGSASTMKDAVDLAILRSNAASSSRRSPNRFEIVRSGDRVANITLTRPAYRLGEAVPVVIDLEHSDIPCCSLHATLETSESIDPIIALRSKASIHRVTRRIHASQSESTLAAKKILFNPIIPLSSTPEFITSGIILEWILRFEFVTGSFSHVEEGRNSVDLMDVIARDERGSVKAAIQGLACETFDVTIPLKVYGAAAGFDEKSEPSDFSM